MFLVFQKVIARWVLGLEKLLLFTIRTTWLICGLGTLFLSLSIAFQDVMKAPMQKLGFARSSAVYQDYYPHTHKHQDNNKYQKSRHNSTDVLANAQDRSSYDSYEVDTVSVNGFLFGCSFIHSVPVIGPVIMPALGIALGHEWADHQTR